MRSKSKVKSIFLIEDDDVFANAFLHSLGKIGDFKKHRFVSVEQSLNRLDKLKPDIIFLDNNLGGVNGIEAIPLFKELRPKTQIVVISNQRKKELIKESIEKGASKYIQKDYLLTSSTKKFIEEFNTNHGEFNLFWTAFLGQYYNIPSKH